MADIPHDTLLYFVRMMNSLLPDRRVPIVSIRGECSLLIVAWISSRVTSLAWSPQPPIMPALATNSGAQNTSTQLHLCVQMRGHWLVLPLNTQRERGSSFWHFEEVIMNYFRISCFVHKLIIMSKNRKLYIFFTIWPKTHFGQEQERIVVTLPIEINTDRPALSHNLLPSFEYFMKHKISLCSSNDPRRNCWPENDYEPLAEEIDEAASNNQNNRPG